MTTRYQGPFANRTDADHVLQQLPSLGGPEHADPRLIQAVESWDPDAGRGGLVLMGPTGCGKTTAAVHLVRRLLATREDATSTAVLLARDIVADAQLAERARRVRFLVVDDIGKEYDPKNVLFSVLDYRHTRLPTIVTSGLKAEDLQSHFTGAFVRRMGEFRGARVRVVSLFKQAPRPAPPPDQDDLDRRYP